MSNKLNNHIIQHNLNEENVKFLLNYFNSKLIAPSIGIVDIKNIIKGFGNISLFSYDESILDNGKVFSSDIYSPRMNFLEFKIIENKLKEYNKKNNIKLINNDFYSTFDSFISDNKKEIEKLVKTTKLLKEKIEEMNKYKKILEEEKPEGKLNKTNEEKLFNLKNELKNINQSRKEKIKTITEQLKEIENEEEKSKYFEKGKEIIEVVNNKIKEIENQIQNINNNRVIDKEIEYEYNNRQQISKEEVKRLEKEIEILKKENEEEIKVKGMEIFEEITDGNLYLATTQNKTTGKWNYKKADNKSIIKKLKTNLVNGENSWVNGFIYFRNEMAEKYTKSNYKNNLNKISKTEDEMKESIYKIEEEIYSLLKNNKEYQNTSNKKDFLTKFYNDYKEGKVKEEFLKEIKKIFKNNYKPHYFEAKPLTEVSLEKFNFCILDNTISEETIKEISTYMEVYKINDEEDKNEKLLNILISKAKTPLKKLELEKELEEYKILNNKEDKNEELYKKLSKKLNLIQKKKQINTINK